MADYAVALLVGNLSLGFYNMGTILAHEIDIFRSWRLIDKKDFPTVQLRHWKKLPYWIFLPVGLALSGSVAMVWIHPAGSEAWAIFGNIACQVLALALTLAFWGPWQAKLSADERGPESPYLDRILRTHWIRTLLICGSAVLLLIWTVGLAVHAGV